jgi:hypothetical protein
MSSSLMSKPPARTHTRRSALQGAPGETQDASRVDVSQDRGCISVSHARHGRGLGVVGEAAHERERQEAHPNGRHRVAAVRRRRLRIHVRLQVLLCPPAHVPATRSPRRVRRSISAIDPRVRGCIRRRRGDGKTLHPTARSATTHRRRHAAALCGRLVSRTRAGRRHAIARDGGTTPTRPALACSRVDTVRRKRMGCGCVLIARAD